MKPAMAVCPPAPQGAVHVGARDGGIGPGRAPVTVGGGRITHSFGDGLGPAALEASRFESADGLEGVEGGGVHWRVRAVAVGLRQGFGDYPPMYDISMRCPELGGFEGVLPLRSSE